MDRVIVYPAAVQQDVDLLNTNKNTMIGLGWLIRAVLGANTRVTGFACTQTTPASLSVNIGPGAIYQSAPIDANPYGSLGTDGVNTIMKQGILTSAITATVTPPSTSGQSVVYLVQVQLQETDGGAQTLAFYNAANPTQPFNGPLNAGTSSNTSRNVRPVIQLKVGTAATTGSQVAPAADSGFVPLYRITVANGATTVVSANIVVDPSAPFITPLA